VHLTSASDAPPPYFEDELMSDISFLPTSSPPKKRLSWLMTSFGLAYLGTGVAIYLFQGPLARMAGLPEWAFGVGLLSLFVTLFCSIEVGRFSFLFAAALMLFMHPYLEFVADIFNASSNPFNEQFVEGVESSAVLTVIGVVGPFVTAACYVAAVESKVRARRRR
jgi:hypothetical protein